MSQVWVIADRPEAVIQPGQPAAQQAAWLLDVPAGQTANQTASDFVDSQGFPIGTIVRSIDVAANPNAVKTFKLASQWVPQ